MKNIIGNLVVSVFGYLIGRAGHFFLGNKINFLHHWIYGLIILVAGIIIYIFSHKLWGLYLIFFGFGIILSDLNDMRHLKSFGRDHLKIKKFWGID
ncbi:MAG TPA: hypothetical protein P5524_02600 [Candidatus Paceibacterota bacterium]|nr:hypothetical protein [Candidatus Paceibacterota bacterium]